MRVVSFLLLSLVALAACGGAGATSTSPPTSYAVSLGSTLVLYGDQFLSPDSNVKLMQPSISPALSQTPPIVWSSNNAAVVAQQTSPNTQVVLPNGGLAAATAPPGESYVFGGTSFGVATVQAQIGAPVNQTATTTVYYYPSLSLGCRFRYAPAFTFDPGNTKPPGITSDLYDTMASDQLGPLDGCGGTAFATAPGTAEMWHTPYGGTFIAGATLANFPTIAASSWQNTATTFAPTSGVLLFKTQGGLIVKALLPVGPFEVTNASGVFPY